MIIKRFELGEIEIEEILSRDKAASADVGAVVSGIIADVRENGDAALKAYAAKFDGAELSSLIVTEQEIDEAMSTADPALVGVMERAADKIRDFHEKQLRQGYVTTPEDGVILGQRFTPLARVGIYVPGGTASYPSSVLMNAVPASVAGVKEIVMATPPRKDGKVAPLILAAARVAGVTKIIKSGGAQAVAALAFGTESVPKVCKITGPGNVFVAEAKRQVYGAVDIDMMAGPSEILVIADDSADPVRTAADLLSQAEHDKNAAAVLVTPSRALADAVEAELERQVALLPREEICRASLLSKGKIIVARDMDETVAVSNAIAPEHLELAVSDPFAILGRIENAGSIFLGHHTPVAVGDYFAGPNHVLPTSGAAHFASPLSVDDFVKKSQFLYYSPEALGKAADDVAAFARAEGFEAHARSVISRFLGK
ncbi:MAG: histidinol dehydrogenase [Clostridia bacterium]|nr:histidinol dehydrogenase [Clostridia bacterium]